MQQTTLLKCMHSFSGFVFFVLVFFGWETRRHWLGLVHMHMMLLHCPSAAPHTPPLPRGRSTPSVFRDLWRSTQLLKFYADVRDSDDVAHFQAIQTRR